MELNRTPYFSLTRPDDNAYIPTLGYPTTACDLFRSIGCPVTGHEGWNSCYADVDTCSGLAKLIEGEITSWEQIEAAELGLQILMWHDRLDVMVPAFKQHSEKISFYKRTNDDRSDLSFDLFKELIPYYILFVVEEVVERDGLIIDSSCHSSPLIGLPSNSEINYLNTSMYQGTVFTVIPNDFGVSAYFSNRKLKDICQRKSWFQNLYSTVRTGWEKNVRIDPYYEFEAVLPPLLSIVLHRAQSRDKIPEAIFYLRHELRKIRNEIVDLSNHIECLKADGAKQHEIAKICTHIQESFNNIVRATTCDSYLRQNLVKLFLLFPSPLSTIIDALVPEKVDITAKAIADRTVSGQMLSKYLRVDNIAKLLEKHFTVAEMFNLSKRSR